MSNSNVGKLLGEKIRNIRKSKNLSQEHVAYLASLSPAHLGQIERGNKKPTVETINKIAEALDVTIIDLFNFDIPQVEVLAEKSHGNLHTINLLLKGMDEESLSEVLKSIKAMIAFKNIK